MVKIFTSLNSARSFMMSLSVTLEHSITVELIVVDMKAFTLTLVLISRTFRLVEYMCTVELSHAHWY
jgi:hypothetical protein